MKIWLKKFFKRNRIKLYVAYLKSKKSTGFFKHVDRNKKKVIVGLAADYSNLGDVAITYAQSEFLQDTFPEYQIVDFPISQTFKRFKELESIVGPEDIITTVGGGNTGDIYDSTEYARQFFIKKFPKNKIISFPQTVDFSDSKKGHHLLTIAKKVYNKHSDLTLVAREVKSYEFYKENFKHNKILLYPDIVLYIDESLPLLNRVGITLSLRKDNEKNIEKSLQEKLVNNIETQYDHVQHYDTAIQKNQLDLSTRKNELEKIWYVFKSSKVVVTDRLHGMIFCAITNTPCVAINNKNHKVSRVFNKWLTEFKFIRMIEKFEIQNILNTVKELYELESNISKSDLTETFEKFKKDIRN